MSLLPSAVLTDGVVRLRPWSEADIPWLIECIKDPEIPRWTRLADFDQAKAEAYIARSKPSPNSLMLAVEEVASGRVVGGVNIARVNLAPPFETVLALSNAFRCTVFWLQAQSCLSLCSSRVLCSLT